MSTPVAPQFQPMHIGEEATPSFAVPPNPAKLFAERAMRFRALAPEHQLQGYLAFLADIADAQAEAVAELPAPALPADDALDRALEYGMAPIARSGVSRDAAMMATLEGLFARFKTIAMPERAQAALDGLIAAEPDERDVMISNVLSDTIPAEEVAEHVFVAAALQVHFACLAAQLPAEKLTPVSDGACPACGGPPVASIVVGWQGSQAARFAVCSACATRWHVVRVKCVACSSTKGIHYAHAQGTADTLKAECCDVCNTYLKILYTITDPALDPVADDVASAGLDLLVKEQGFGRSGFNAFLAGF